MKSCRGTPPFLEVPFRKMQKPATDVWTQNNGNLVCGTTGSVVDGHKCFLVKKMVKTTLRNIQCSLREFKISEDFAMLRLRLFVLTFVSVLSDGCIPHKTG
jgi:hypothetical protein